MKINIPVTSDHIAIVSVLITVLTFILIFTYGKVNKIDISLQDLISRSLAGSTLPTAVVILLCAIDLNLLKKLGGILQVYIALAGLSLLYVALMTIFSSFNEKHSVVGQTCY